MKILIVITFFLCSISFSFGTDQVQSTGKVPEIHKSKRVFVKKQDRPYIRKKKILLLNQVQAQKSVVNLIESGNKKELMQDYKGALADFNKALLFEPKNAEVLYYCGFMKFQMEDYANALADYDLSISIDTESVELYYCRGNAKIELKYFKEAIADYDKALSLDSTDASTYYNRALAKYFSDVKEPFCKDLRSALKYGDKEAEAVLKEYCE